MKIDGPKNIYTSINTENLSNENDSILKDIELSQLEEMQLMDIFEKTIVEDKFQVYDLLSIKNISKEVEIIYGQIKEKIEDMVTEQIKALGLFKNGDSLNIDINMINKEKTLQEWTNTIKEEKLVGENPKENISKIDIFKTDKSQIDKVKTNRDNLSKYNSSGNKVGFFDKTKLDTELSSEEIVVFVKNISDEGKAKLVILGKIVIDIFSKIEKDMEELPDISKKTYVRIMEKLDNLIAIEKFKDQPEGIKLELRKIIEDTIIEQTKIYERLKMDGISIKSEVTIENQKALLYLQGPLGAKESSKRILYFVRNASNGDKKKLSNLAKEINKVFNTLEKALGELPEISKKTYEKIMEDLYEDEELKEIMNIYSNIFYEFASMYRRAQSNTILKQKGIKQFAAIITVSLILYYIIKTL